MMQPAYYQVRVQGYIDQAALPGILAQLSDPGLPLLSVHEVLADDQRAHSPFKKDGAR